MKTALVTGASQGIGRELARQFANDGWNLVLVARNGAKLQEVAKELSGPQRDIFVIASDLSRDGAADDLFAAVRQSGREIDALVNNAGIATHGLFADLPIAAELEEIHLNVVALTHLTKLFLAPMIAKGHGYLLNVASTAGFQPGPLMAVYYATKAYVLSLSESLANELHGTGVSVTALCPGPTETGFQSRANMPRTRLFKSGGGDPAGVARAGYRAMLARRTIVIPGLWNQIMTLSVRVSPRGLVTSIVRRMNEAT